MGSPEHAGSGPSPTPGTPPVLFFDAQCGLCTRSVQWLLRHDRRGVLCFAPLQGETFSRLSRGTPVPADLNTAVLADERGVHLRSEAVLRAAGYLGGFWGAAGRIGRWVPTPLRESAYRFAAARRIGWFGPATSCPLDPGPYRSRFLP